MSKKKIFILLPDGVGIRNFVLTDFYKIGINHNFEVIFWNKTNYEINFPSIKIPNKKSSFLTEIFKIARKNIELNLFCEKFKNKTYLNYKFPYKFKNIKSILKSCVIFLIEQIFSSEKGYKIVRKLMYKFERKSTYYKSVKSQLEKHKPEFIFSTNQRPLAAVAPILAAKDLGIPTATFIFSWDNLPKATLVIETNFYFAWSKHMKKELLQYYPFITENQIFVSGTPQFEPYFNESLIQKKERFFIKYNLQTERKYICFSGDDVTTSPYDQYYLKDVAEEIRNLNSKGYNLGLIYRKCPVDISNRHIEICNEFNDVITIIDPAWEKYGINWNEIFPTVEDQELLINTIKNTEMVINIGSSMVFDYVIFNKPTAFINYNCKDVEKIKWDINNIYKYIHFKSMPDKKSVLWINNKEEIEKVILKGLSNVNLDSTKIWLEKIIGENPSKASLNLWEIIEKILQ